jgi:hypothetical protein
MIRLGKLVLIAAKPYFVMKGFSVRNQKQKMDLLVDVSVVNVNKDS